MQGAHGKELIPAVHIVSADSDITAVAAFVAVIGAGAGEDDAVSGHKGNGTGIGRIGAGRVVYVAALDGIADGDAGDLTGLGNEQGVDEAVAGVLNAQQGAVVTDAVNVDDGGIVFHGKRLGIFGKYGNAAQQHCQRHDQSKQFLHRFYPRFRLS